MGWVSIRYNGIRAPFDDVPIHRSETSCEDLQLTEE